MKYGNEQELFNSHNVASFLYYVAPHGVKIQKNETKIRNDWKSPP